MSWFSSEIRSLICERDFAYRRFKKLRSEACFSIYKSLRNKVNEKIKAAKRKYFLRKFNPKLPSKVLWSNLKKTGVCKTATVVNSVMDPNSLNIFFTSSVQNQLDSAHCGDSGNNLEGFSFNCVSNTEVIQAIFSIRSKAAGSDNISPRFLKLILPFIINTLTNIFNNCLMRSEFPILWIEAIVKPIPKITNPVQPSDFRPINILNFLGKTLEKIMSVQIQNHVAYERLLVEFQSGFRPKHSCDTALLKVTTDIREHLDNNRLVVMALLDFTKAFDSVNHNLQTLK